MQYSIRIVVMCVVIALAAYSQELLINGDFEDPHGKGWDTVSSISDTGMVTHSIETEGVLKLSLSGACYTTGSSLKASQVVDVQGLELEGLTFSAKKRFSSHAIEGMNITSIIISYISNSGIPLGSTKLFQFSSIQGVPINNVGWLNELNQNSYSISDSVWDTISLNVGNEITQIGTINPEDIAKVEVMIFDTAIVYS